MIARFILAFALLIVSVPVWSQSARDSVTSATVSGTIIWMDDDGDPANAPRPVRRNEAGCVVYLMAKDESTHQQLLERERLVQWVNQSGKEFTPRLQIVQKNSKVRFGNADTFFHNVYSNDPEFNLGRYPKGFFREQEFTETGVTHLFCDIHPRMHAVILVVDTPLFATVTTDWTFEIGNVPDGDYTLVCWHMREGEHAMDLRVDGMTTVTVEPVLGAGDDINRPRRSEPAVPPSGS